MDFWLIAFIAVVVIGAVLVLQYLAHKRKVAAGSTRRRTATSSTGTGQAVENADLVAWKAGRIELSTVDHLLDYVHDILDQVPSFVGKPR